MSLPLWLNPALAVYRQLRSGKNRLLNLVDPPVVVLIYHRVMVLSADPHRLAVSPENFRAQMEYLKENFRLVLFDEEWSKVQEPAVAVTFDDGYADNYLHALPILEEVGIPATFFISTGTLGTRKEFWWDELERLVLGAIDCPRRFHLQDPEFARSWATASREERLCMHDELHPLLQKLRAPRREEWLEQLRTWAGVDRTGRATNRPLTADEVKKLGASPWATIGAHGVTHTCLSILPENEQWQEIAASKQRLEELLGTQVETFCYPYGNRVHYNRTTLELCCRAGFRKAAANFPGQAHRWTSPFEVPRHVVRDWDVATFSARLKCFWS